MMMNQCNQRAQQSERQVRQTIMACCFDLRGYKKLLKQDDQQLARILQLFVSYVGQALEQIPGLEQLSLQGDAIIAVYALKTEAEVGTRVEQLAQIIEHQGQLQAQLISEALPPIQFGLGIDCGEVIKTTTYIPSVQGVLYVGQVISTAIRLSDYAQREPDFFPIVVSETVQKHISMQCNTPDKFEIGYYFYQSTSLTQPLVESKK